MHDGREYTDLLAELVRMKATHVVLSTNIRLRLDGIPYASASEPGDPGIAIYFRRKLNGTVKPFAMACDQYNRLADNCRALFLTIESLRRIERHGSSQLMEQAFSGFAELPPARTGIRPWHEVLGITEESSGARAPYILAMVKGKFRELTAKHHPDHGGDHARMAEIADANDRAKAELLELGDERWRQ